MADEPQNDAPEGAEAQGAAQGANGAAEAPSLNVLTQYIKDLSFEAPGAPGSLRRPRQGARDPPSA